MLWNVTQLFRTYKGLIVKINIISMSLLRMERFNDYIPGKNAVFLVP